MADSESQASSNTEPPLVDTSAPQRASGFGAALRRAYARFIKIRGTPREIALGFALGLFVGMSPALGFQMIIAVSLAALFKWNKIAAAGGVWISNPITAPVLYGLTYVTGAKLLGIHLVQFEAGLTKVSSFLKVLAAAPEIFWLMTVGGIVLGLPVACLGYYLAFSAVQKYQDDIRRKIAAGKERLAQKRATAKRRGKRKKPNRGRV